MFTFCNATDHNVTDNETSFFEFCIDQEIFKKCIGPLSIEQLPSLNRAVLKLLSSKADTANLTNQNDALKHLINEKSEDLKTFDIYSDIFFSGCSILLSFILIILKDCINMHRMKQKNQMISNQIRFIEEKLNKMKKRLINYITKYKKTNFTEQDHPKVILRVFCIF